jgi:hypothetical protein
MQVVDLLICWMPFNCFIQFIVRYGILTAMSVKIMVFQNVMLHNSVAKYQCFRTTTLKMEMAGLFEMSVAGGCLPNYSVSHLR